jgi:ElaB/YqjD/DUF883 family membrane-anchored ribosome-binding protein
MMPETFVRNWQMTGLRVLRAQERMLHGMMSAARLEIQFGQDLLKNRMARFTPRSENRARTDGGFQEFDRMISMMREVTEELRSGFSEATQLLTDTADEALRETTKKAGQTAQALADRGAEAVHESLQTSEKFTKKIVEPAAEAARDTTEEAASAARDTSKEATSTGRDTGKEARDTSKEATSTGRDTTKEAAAASRESARPKSPSP